MKTVTVFRTDREGVVFALFPLDPATSDGRYCECYQHGGQHSAADYVGCIATSRPAHPSEYAPLLRELIGAGYTPDVRTRRPRR
jgi:hypothetical protein